MCRQQQIDKDIYFDRCRSELIGCDLYADGIYQLEAELVKLITACMLDYFRSKHGL